MHVGDTRQNDIPALHRFIKRQLNFNANYFMNKYAESTDDISLLKCINDETIYYKRNVVFANQHNISLVITLTHQHADTKTNTKNIVRPPRQFDTSG